MTDKLQNLLTDHTDKLTNVIIDKIQYYTKNYDKVNVYNLNKPSLMQKIWILTPKLKVVSIVSKPNDKFHLSLPLRLLINNTEHKVFLNFLKRIEHKIGELITKTTIKSKVEENNRKFSILNVNMPFDGNNEFMFQVYNQHNKRMLVSNIKSGSYVKCFLELTDVYINNEKYGCNWSVLQMKVYPEFDFSVCLFENDLPEENKIKEEECYHCLYCPNHHVRTSMQIATIPVAPPLNIPIAPPLIPNELLHSIRSQHNIKPKEIEKVKKEIYLRPFVPTMNDLLNVKLKKVNINEDKVCEDKYLNNILDVKSRLKPVPEDKLEIEEDEEEDLLEKELRMLENF